MFRITASWSAQSQSFQIGSRFGSRLHGVPNPTMWLFRVVSCATAGASFTMVTCDCVSHGTLRAAFLCALCGQKNICMDPRAKIFALVGPHKQHQQHHTQTNQCRREHTTQSTHDRMGRGAPHPTAHTPHRIAGIQNTPSHKWDSRSAYGSSDTEQDIRSDTQDVLS